VAQMLHVHGGTLLAHGAVLDERAGEDVRPVLRLFIGAQH
jgi:hypothetical protein